MFKLIYDWNNGYDISKGIEETYDTWKEANDAIWDLKAIDGHSNFTIVDLTN